MTQANSVSGASGFLFKERRVETATGTARISFLTCDPMERAGFVNAFSTRLGGVSPLPSESLNLAYFSGDAKANVTENRRRFLKAIRRDDGVIITARQTHSTERCVIESVEQARGPQPECDAMTSQITGLLVAVQTADCLPVLIADPASGTFAAIHAGWRGTAGRITERTIADLMLLHGVNTRSAIAALGPAACSQCYEVGEDVIEIYKKEFGYWRKLLTNFTEGAKPHLDIRAANIQQLAFCGFTEDRIHVAPHCTMHQNDLFFSYRREGRGKPSSVGRLLAVVGSRDSY
ncbi:MAG TPA: peptidoglycan editing factor PgeF [Blastocatellia bacterium]|nr:peptidoglycan editing factor PgeF [Blastocatellia bacterium]